MGVLSRAAEATPAQALKPGIRRPSIGIRRRVLSQWLRWPAKFVPHAVELGRIIEREQGDFCALAVLTAEGPVVDRCPVPEVGTELPEGYRAALAT